MTFQLDVIDTKRSIFSGLAQKVVVPALDGELTIKARHMPLVTPLSLGELIIGVEGAGSIHLSIGKGMLSVSKNTVTILAESTLASDEISEDEALRAVARAKEIIEKGVEPEGKLAAHETLRRSLIDLKVARRRRKIPAI